MENEKVCTLIINGDKKVQPTPMDIQKKIEAASSVYMQRKDAKKLAEALEELLLFMVNGNSYPKLLMTIIRFVITCDDHRVKKLCAIYWEICEKVKDNGELKEEMVLVCNAIRNDLIHSNEYIRGRTLRLLCRMRYFKIMEPLVESVLKNLSHRHAYVRRNAVTCVYSIVKTFGPDVIPQASIEIEQLLLVEGDLSTKRIAFIMLLNCDIDRAINYAISVEEQVTSLGDVFQLALLELVRKVAKVRPGHKARLMKLVFYLSNASSPGVMFECAQILSNLTSSPSAAQMAAVSYVNLINTQPDNNVKLIVLDHLAQMAETDKHVVESLVMDLCRGLSCPALGVRRRIIAIVCGLLSSRNVADVVTLLRKELVRLQSEYESTQEYRRLLILTLQDACRKFPEFSENVFTSLFDILKEKSTDQTTSFQIIDYFREMMAADKETTNLIVVEKLVQIVPQIDRSRVLRMILWLIGEFSNQPLAHIQALVSAIGPLPVDLLMPNAGDVDKEVSEVAAPTAAPRVVSTRTIVLADGTYASQAVYGSSSAALPGSSGLRTLLCGGDILLATLTGVVLAKLWNKQQHSKNGPLNTNLQNTVLFAISCLIRIVKKSLAFGGNTARLVHCFRSVADPKSAQLLHREWETSRDTLAKLIVSETSLRFQKSAPLLPKERAAIGPVGFRLLKSKRELLVAADPSLVVHAEEASLIPGVMAATVNVPTHAFSERLAKAVPLTGLADPVYIEGFLRLHSYDLILELSIVNRSSETLGNILVELCTHGSLQVVDKPVAVTLGPGETQTVFATIKVSCTENGALFGYATFDRKSSEKEWMVLNEIRADVLDYISPNCAIGESDFKTMWQDFEWENKIVVKTHHSMSGFIKTLSKHTNLKIVGTETQIKLAETLLAECKFAGINLYAKSIFGEDALANVSLESKDGSVFGSVRIRARTQGIALSLGDKINQFQREEQMRGA